MSSIWSGASRAGPRPPPCHLLRDLRRQQIRLGAAEHEGRATYGVPHRPQIHILERGRPQGRTDGRVVVEGEGAVRKHASAMFREMLGEVASTSDNVG